MSLPQESYGDQRVPKTQRLVAPSGNEQFSEWSREEKDEYARKRMEEMKLKNEKYMQRYAEVEKDRIENSPVSSILSLPMEKLGISEELPDSVDVGSKPKVEVREWDRKKSLVNLEHWNNRKPDNRPDIYHQNDRRSFANRRSAKIEDNYRNQNYSRFKNSGTSQSKGNYRNVASSKPEKAGYRNKPWYGYNREEEYLETVPKTSDSDRDPKSKLSSCEKSLKQPLIDDTDYHDNSETLNKQQNSTED